MSDKKRVEKKDTVAELMKTRDNAFLVINIAGYDAGVVVVTAVKMKIDGYSKFKDKITTVNGKHNYEIMLIEDKYKDEIMKLTPDEQTRLYVASTMKLLARPK